MSERIPTEQQYDATAVVRKKVYILLDKAARGELTVDDQLAIRTLKALLELSNVARTEHPKFNYRPVIIAVICIVIVSLLITLRIGDTRFIPGLASNSISLDIVAKSISFQFKPDKTSINLIKDPSPAKYVKVSSLSKFNAPEATLLFENKVSSFNFSVAGDSIFVNEIELQNESEIKINQTEGATNIEITGSPVKGVLAVKKAKLSFPRSPDLTLSRKEYPEFIYFSKDSSKLDWPFKIRIQSQYLNLFDSKRVSNLSFVLEYVEGFDLVSYESSICEGSIHMHDIEKKILLSDGERVVFNEFEGVITELAIKDGFIHAKLTGKARHIKTGPEYVQREQSPTLMEYFYRNQPLAVLWAAIAFVWGLASNVNTTLFQKPQ